MATQMFTPRNMDWKYGGEKEEEEKVKPLPGVTKVQDAGAEPVDPAPVRPSGIRTPVLDYSMGKKTPIPTADVTQPWEKNRRPDYSIREPAVDGTIGSPQRVWPVVNQPLDLNARKGDTQKQLDELKAKRTALEEQAKAEQEAKRQKGEEKRDYDPLSSLNGTTGKSEQPKQSSTNQNIPGAQTYNMGVGAYTSNEQKYVPGGDRKPDNTGVYPRHSYQGATATTELSDIDKELKELDRQIREKEDHMQMLERTEKLQQRGKRKAELEQVAEKEDFAKKSRYVSTALEGFWEKATSDYSMGYEDLTYEYINDTPGVRDKVKGLNVASGVLNFPDIIGSTYEEFADNEHDISSKGYEYMKPKEVKIYNYLYRRKGRETAEEYLDLLQEELNERKGGKIADDLEEKTLLQYGYGFAAGVDQFKQGVKNAVNVTDDYIPVSATQFASRDIREDLYNTGSDIMDSTSWGQVGYDLFNTTGNMLPSIALNIAAPGVGTASMGVSAAGNAYQSMLNEGYTKEQSRAYSTMVGISEVCMEKFLNGIPQMGKSVMSEKVLGNLAKLDNVFGRVAKSKVGQMFFSGFSEAVEEPTQNVVENLLWSAVTGEEIDIQGEELIYDGLLAFMTGGSFKGVDILTNSGKKAGGGAEGVKAPESAVTAESEGVAADAAKSERPGMELLEGFDIPKSEAPVKTEEQQRLDAVHREMMGMEEQKNTAQADGVESQLREYTQHEKENWKNSKRIVIYEGLEHFRQFIRNALTGKVQTNRKMYFGAIKPKLAENIRNATGVNVEGYNLSLGENEIRKINKDHGNPQKETPRGQRAVSEDDYLSIPDVVQWADSITLSPKQYEGKPVIEFRKTNGNETTVVAGVVSDKRLDLFVQTAFVNKKTGSIATPEPVQADSFTPEATGGTAPLEVSQSTDTIGPGATPKAESADTQSWAEQSTNANRPGATSEMESVGSSKNSLPQDGGAVKEDFGAKGRDESVGAATRGFTGKEGYNDLLTDENSQPDRPGDVRPMEVLKTDRYGRRVSEFAANAYGAEVTPDNMADTVQELIDEGALGFDTRTNQESLEAAAKAIEKKGMAATERAITKAVADGKVQDGDIEKAMILYAQYANKKSHAAQERAAELMVDLATMANMTGRNLQLFKLLRKMTPEGQLMTVKKETQRAVEKMQKSGKVKKDFTPEVDPKLEQEYLEAAEITTSSENATAQGLAKVVDQQMQESTESAAELAVDAALAKVEAQKNLDRQADGAAETENAPATNDFAENMGRRVADRLAAQARSQNTSVEDILFRDIMRFANDKVAVNKETSANRMENLETLRDYFQYRPFFQTAWDSARARVEQTMENMTADDPRIEKLEQFLASGDAFVGIENTAPVMAWDFGDPGSTVRRGAKEAANAAGIRMDNRTERTKEAKRQMRDILIENRTSKEAAAREIARVAVEQMGLEGTAAQELGQTMIRAFYHDLAEQSARRVAQMFTKPEIRKTVQKSMMQKLEELYNMGAFSMPEYRQAAFDSLFGADSDIDIPDSMLQQFTESAEEDKAKIQEAIYLTVAAQMPATFRAKWDAWRYMAMLGNVKTQVRNFIGNLAFRPYVEVKRALGAAVEKMFVKKENRTKALMGLGKADRDLLNWAKEDAKTTAADALQYSAKLGDDVSASKISEGKKVFDSKLLEGFRKITEAAPAKADLVFKNWEYIKSLAGFLKARGFTAEDVQAGKVDGGVLEDARNYAIREAMKATFNDANAFSDFMSMRFREDGKTKAARAFEISANIAMDGVLPFRRTPANIVVRMKEYSPVEIGRGVWNLAANVKNGKVSAATAIDQIASGVTGTGAIVLGWAMANGLFGIRLRGSDVSDEEKEQGHQPYSMEFYIDGELHSYKIDWCAPANLPLFIGANICDSVRNGGGDTNLSGFTSTVYAMGHAFEPMLSLSCLSSLNDLLQAGRYAGEGDAIYSVISTMATSYITQGIPALLRQADQAAKENEMVTFANHEDPLIRGMQRTLANVPFVGRAMGLKVDKIDEDGNTVSRGNLWERGANAFFNPGTHKVIHTDAVDEERQRLSEELGEDVSVPDVAKTITYTDNDGVKHENYRLTGEEYTEFQKVQGQTQNRILGEIVESDNYEALTDEQKEKVFGYVDDYARESGRMEAIEGYPGFKDSWMEGIEGKEADVILQKVVKGTFDDAFSGMTECWKNGKDDSASVEALEEAYQVYKGLDKDTRAAVMEASGGRLEAYFNARQNGIDTETFVKYYEKYYEIDNEDLKESEKAAKWSYELQKAVEKGKLDQDEEKVLRESLKFYNMFPADTAKFDQLTDAGIDSGDAWQIGELLDGLEPEKGRTTVRDVQKYEEIADYDGLTSKEMDIVMKMYMPDYDPNAEKPDKTELKYDTVRGMGFTPAEYAQMLRIYQDEKDAGGRGTKQRTISQLQKEMGVSRGVATKLYEIYYGSYFKKK